MYLLDSSLEQVRKLKLSVFLETYLKFVEAEILKLSFFLREYLKFVEAEILKLNVSLGKYPKFGVDNNQYKHYIVA